MLPEIVEARERVATNSTDEGLLSRVFSGHELAPNTRRDRTLEDIPDVPQEMLLSGEGHPTLGPVAFERLLLFRIGLFRECRRWALLSVPDVGRVCDLLRILLALRQRWWWLLVRHLSHGERLGYATLMSVMGLMGHELVLMERRRLR